ncbi:putative secreted hydrolase [Sulfurisoma sediminicola]|uniref:Putative secreted hydrolase n=2 Tax=Sulfurisoma sediminicola TaxID=1381557 RepID=A0A497XM64_9PROT|nr:putative secreted hydrolase [Sulfurisoma sediminicola]
MRRRRMLQLLGAAGCLPLASLLPSRAALAAAPSFPPVRPRALAFPRDHGAHPDYRTEWWYATGWLETAEGPAGFQVTFFRSRTAHDPANPSRFAPHQLLFAHAALAWPGHGRLRHAQRAARVGDGDESTRFALEDTAVAVQGWSFSRDAATGRYAATVADQALALRLGLAPTQPLLLQGDRGFSRKGPRPEQASHYYSQPQLAVSGTVGFEGKSLPVRGRAWLDHEWSTAVLDEESVGWDWIGINLDDGGALMAFRIRGRDGAAVRWASARLRERDGRELSYGPDAVRFETLGTWRSPRTGTSYPVRSRLTLGQGTAALRFDIEPLIEDQELDARLSTGAVYWEGAVSLRHDGRTVGRGYLELVGYHRPMKL